MIPLMYHDIVAAEDADASGFPGRDSALYKVAPPQFDKHLRSLASTLAAQPDARAVPALTITFDDGGAAAMVAAELLERYRFVGHFFVTTNYIGSPGFVHAAHLRDLRARGHTVGSHSASHPLRIGHCSWLRLVEEWTQSRDTLAQVLGENIQCASVPGGDFAAAVARAAGEAGFSRLFTSEPTRRVYTLFDVTVLGRFTVHRWTRARTIGSLAAGSRVPTARQAVVWNAKKLSKLIAGERYLHLRRLLLRHGTEVRWGDRT
jgi:peptidoglycan/xylan/chitin deacetylase (PgdA/CDA1 family)